MPESQLYRQVDTGKLTLAARHVIRHTFANDSPSSILHTEPFRCIPQLTNTVALKAMTVSKVRAQLFLSWMPRCQSRLESAHGNLRSA